MLFGAKQTQEGYSFEPSERYPHQWGFVDTAFEVRDLAKRLVRVTGKRYPLSGYDMPGFFDYLEEILQYQITKHKPLVFKEHPTVTRPKMNERFLLAVQNKFGPEFSSSDDQQRLIHSHGQTSADEVYKIYFSKLPRAVDLVVYPKSNAEVEAVVMLANKHKVCLIPYGGGTNVSGALLIPDEEKRMVVSVDMSRMNKILWIDTVNQQACIQAGMTGLAIERELNSVGFTIGHEPDSMEFSTLGGWISTHASGMKKNKYGNIEEIVLDLSVATPKGWIESYRAIPRGSVSVHPMRNLFGSEGNLGVITQAVVKVFRKPEHRAYQSMIFKDMPTGIEFLKKLRKRGRLPASARLMDNAQFRFGMALKPKATIVHSMVDRLKKLMITRVFGFNPHSMVACTLLFEGSKGEVERDCRKALEIGKSCGGLVGGETNGKRGYMLTFGIAYIRDFLFKYHIIGETFETSIAWDRIITVTDAVNEKFRSEAKARGILGTPYLSFRVTQTYHTGVCIYFMIAFVTRGLADPSKTFHEIEAELRKTIIEHGGSLSHHHGIGKIRQRFLPEVFSSVAIDGLKGLKNAIDPNNVFGVRNGVFT